MNSEALVNNTPAKFRQARLGGALTGTLRDADDGVQYFDSSEALAPYALTLCERLEFWAKETPDRIFVARRRVGADEHAPQWDTITYAQMLDRSRRVASAIITRGLSAERPIAILSDNDLDHLTLAMGAMWAGVPYAPISAAYSLISQDFGKLKHIAQVLTPGLVFASNLTLYGKAIQAVFGTSTEVLSSDGTKTLSDWIAEYNPQDSDAAHALIGPDTIVKFLFTSGSTKMPKGVINTQRMLCANQQMIRQCFAFLQDEPPVMVDWLPWNHTFGGNHNVGIVLYNGGTLYIDDGKPVPALMYKTLGLLREISPTIYFNVPKGWEELTAALASEPALRKLFFSRVQIFFFAGAGLSQSVWNHLNRLSESECQGERVKMATGLGMTETAPSSTFALHDGVASGHIGLPVPGCTLKLVPLAGKLEVRFRGPHVMPGYWRAPEQTAEVFDEEGFYCTGDAVKLIDPNDLSLGFFFDGRIAEDFKLATGTFVSVGPLRAKIAAAGSPYVQDSVITGVNQNEVGAMIFPRLDDCRVLSGLPAQATAQEVLTHPKVEAFFSDLVTNLYASGTGSATRVARALLLSVPPSIDKGEVTDKGSINQRAVLACRAELVERLHANPAIHDGSPKLFMAQ
jgi:feruloyl-CoA synthase